VLPSCARRRWQKSARSDLNLPPCSGSYRVGLPRAGSGANAWNSDRESTRAATREFYGGVTAHIFLHNQQHSADFPPPLSVIAFQPEIKRSRTTRPELLFQRLK